MAQQYPVSASSAASSADATIAGTTLDHTQLKRMGAILQSRFTQYENDRRPQELKWMRNLRQWLGEYDPEVKNSMGPIRSRAYPKLTRVKVISMVARLMNLLFPASEKNWGIRPSPVPNLPADVLAAAVNEVFKTTPAAADAAMAGEEMPTDLDAKLEKAILDIAKRRAERLENTVEDQLAELGGSKEMDYVTLCREVLMSGVLYSLGVLKGPFVRETKCSKWRRNLLGGIEVYEDVKFRPMFQCVNVWDYYPDMSARTFSEMDGQFERHVMSRHQLRALADRSDFFGEVIRDYLNRTQQGNYRARPFETDLHTAGVASNVNRTGGNKFEVIEWTGYDSGHTLKLAGFDIPDDQLNAEIEINFWMLEDEVIKADVSPWADMGENRVTMYHQFVYEKDDTALTGNGLPNVIRDSQMGVCAAARMVLDNGGVTSLSQFEVNTRLLRPDQDLGTIAPGKIWYRDDDGQSAQYPAIREIKIDSHIVELKQIVEMFSAFADQESFINPATGGDVQKMPSEPFRSAAGASMLKGDLALPFKDAIRNFDGFTISVISAMIAFNRQFNDDAETRGDYAPVARGSSSLVAKEVRGIQLDQYVQLMPAQEQAYVNWYSLARERAKVRDLPVDDVLVSKADADQIDTSNRDASAKESLVQERIIEATVKKLLSEVLKNLTQADKNQTTAEATQAKAILEVLEGGKPKDQSGEGKAPPGAAGGGGQ